MTDAFASLDGQRLTKLRMVAANIGPWFAEVDLEEAPTVARRVTITVGALQLSGTLLPQQAGAFALQRKCRIIAGAAGWSQSLKARAYHSDAGIKARLVAEDAAREVGETLGAFVPAAERLGIDYVRQIGVASRTLEDVIGGVAWWVDYAGVTHVGPRPAVAVDAAAYELLSFDPRARIATLAVDDPGAIVVGATILSERLEAPQTVREVSLHVTADGMRIVAWCGGGEAEAGRLAGLLTTIARRATDRPLTGLYRYRVIRMAADARVELQAVRKVVGLPDIMPVSQWPGVPGVHAELAPGAEVLVQFVEGDRSQPIVTHYAGPDGVGFVPVSLAFGGSVQAAARQGDLVQSGGAGCVAILTPLTGVGAPPNNAVVAGVPHLVSFSTDPLAVGPTAAPLYGAISTGSPKVRV